MTKPERMIREMVEEALDNYVGPGRMFAVNKLSDKLKGYNPHVVNAISAWLHACYMESLRGETFPFIGVDDIEAAVEEHLIDDGSTLSHAMDAATEVTKILGERNQNYYKLLNEGE